WLAGASGYSRARALVEARGALETPSSRRLPADQRLISPGPGRLLLRPGRPSAPCRRPRAPVPAGAVHRRPLAAAGMEWMGGGCGGRLLQLPSRNKPSPERRRRRKPASGDSNRSVRPYTVIGRDQSITPASLA